MVSVKTAVSRLACGVVGFSAGVSSWCVCTCVRACVSVAGLTINMLVRPPKVSYSTWVSKEW